MPGDEQIADAFPVLITSWTRQARVSTGAALTVTTMAVAAS
jgi:hypothetical protein